MRVNFLQYRKISFVTIVCVSQVILMSHCIDADKENEDKQSPIETVSSVEFSNFVGAEACKTCHTEIYQSHQNTAHFKTSSLASDSTIRGSFAKGKNSYVFSNGSIMMMENRNGIFHQTEFIDGIEKRTHTMDIVVGSGTKGQSFLYWGEKRLYQHPMTYFTARDQWSNSPGYPNKAMFQKPVTGRCMECHTSFAGFAPNDQPKQVAENFNKDQLILGINCERCHGPGKEHVSFHQQNPGDSIGKNIRNPANFTRRQKLDLCALCHAGGLLKPQTASFEYTAGDDLSKYFTWDTSGISNKYLDVHGNQYGLMMLSRCYQQSGELTCNSCHQPHENEKNKVKIYSTRCMNCHTVSKGNFCTLKDKSVKSLAENCIDCHMPKQMSRSIAVQLQGETVPTPSLLRTHFIQVYDKDVNAFVEGEKKAEKKKL